MRLPGLRTKRNMVAGQQTETKGHGQDTRSGRSAEASQTVALGIVSDVGSGCTAERDWTKGKVEQCQASWAEARNILGMDLVIRVCGLAS